MIRFIETGSVTTPAGFLASGVRADIKQKGKDVALILSEQPTATAAMFTTNRVPAHCIVLNSQMLENGAPRGVIINAGNANCCTGAQGRTDAEEMSRRTANALDLQTTDIFNLSTGVIGEPMPMQKIRSGIDQAVAALSPNGGLDAAAAIMTTDTVAKHAAVQFKLDGVPCHIGAIAKGSGMINPNLATMFCIFTTDVNIEPPLLDQAFRTVVDQSLNALSVDGEMSTNDCALIFANGAAGNPRLVEKNDHFEIFVDALLQLAKFMTEKLARDGEGATKCVTVTVSGAKSRAEAKIAAEAIANSMLVKTAVFGRDPNWGRVVQAAGASGVELDTESFFVDFAGIRVAENGGTVPYDSEKMKQALSENDVQIRMGLGAGDASSTIFTCDLTYDYIEINAEYHT